MKLRVVMTNGINYLIESGEFKDKEGIVSLKENEQFEATFKIEINQ